MNKKLFNELKKSVRQGGKIIKNEKNLKKDVSGKKKTMQKKKKSKAEIETLYLLSIPGMKESLIKARKEPIEKCLTKLQW